jgi:hypothetical protein
VPGGGGDADGPSASGVPEVAVVDTKNARSEIVVTPATVGLYKLGLYKLTRSLQAPGSNHRAVALQVAFERQTLKPVLRLIGYRLWV